MTRLFFMATLFWTTSVGFAQSWWMPKSLSCMMNSHEIKNSLVLSGFSCKTKTSKLCTYTECLGKIPSYPKPILVTVPMMAESMRLHFHGHKLGTFPAYEKDLPSMISAFGLEDELCQTKEVTVFPSSDGRCATYDAKLITKQDFQKFLNELHSATGNNLKNAALNLSAHSGGGRTVTRFLDAGLPAENVTIFDGIYAQSQKNSLKNWYKLGNGRLILATVKGMSPDVYTNQLKAELGLKTNLSQTTIDGTKFDVSKTNRFEHYSRGIVNGESLKAHYDVLSQTWKTSN